MTLPQPLPRTDRPDRLKLELALCPSCDREDAMQEAWLAKLEGRSPARAVNTFAQRERRHRQRMTPMSVALSWVGRSAPEPADEDQAVA